MRIHIKDGNLQFDFDSRKMDAKLARSQKKLDAQILADCLPLVPFSQGELRSSGHIVEPGLLQWDGPYAHYQYTGILYLTEDGRTIAEKGEKKYPTDKNLKYHEPNTTDHWFEEAKRQYKKKWIDLTRKGVE